MHVCASKSNNQKESYSEKRNFPKISNSNNYSNSVWNTMNGMLQLFSD